MKEKRKHHYLENDFRYIGLKSLFQKYDEIIDYNKKNCFYECYWDETYFIYGIILVSLQNYINQNCKDFLDSRMLSIGSRSSYYTVHSREVKDGITEIQLIIHLANYFKHSDDNSCLHEYTFKSLKNVGLIDSEITKEAELVNRKNNRFEYDVVIEGIDMISPLEEPMLNLLMIVKKWREAIWNQYYIEQGMK